jgi:hypothetical protein
VNTVDDNSQTIISMPTQWPHQSDVLNFSQHVAPGVAALLVLAGVVYLLWGYSIFKVLVVLNAAALGAVLGAALGQKGDSAAIGGCLGALVLGAMAWPFMKHAIALMGGIYGGLLGGGIWQTFGLDPRLYWAGALVGLIAFGLLTFILFRGSIMMYTSLQGAFMLLTGVLGLAFKHAEVAPKVIHQASIQPILMPAAVLVPALIGVIYQQSTSTPAPAGKH